ncbi:unnamed protein product [Sphagnum tenellum]
MATSVGVSPIPGLATVAIRSSSLLLLENPSVGSNNRRKRGGCYSRPASRQHLQRKHQQQSSRRFRFAGGPVAFRVKAEASSSGSSGSSTEDGRRTSSSSTGGTTKTIELTEVDKIMEGVSFSQLCDDFECISSPAVEKTARQLLKDILAIREGNRSLGNFGIFARYKDPLRSFTGREKYRRANWIRTALDNPTVAVREMTMLSTSMLNIKWTLRGKPRLPPASVIGGDVILLVDSTFTLNQISGQVIDHEDEWDLSASDLLAQAYFWTSRLAFSTVEAGKDAAEVVKGISKTLNRGKEDDRSSYYPDPSGDPRKFFQVEENPQRDFYQIGLVIALLYLLVQFLRLTL